MGISGMDGVSATHGWYHDAGSGSERWIKRANRKSQGMAGSGKAEPGIGCFIPFKHLAGFPVRLGASTSEDGALGSLARGTVRSS